MNAIPISTNLLGLLFVLLFIVLIVLFILRQPRGKRPNLRKLHAFSHLRDNIASSVESGEGIHLSLGHGGVDGPKGAAGLLGLTVLERVGRVASISDQPPVVTSGESTLAILSQDVLRNVLRDIGESGQFDPFAAQVSGLTPLSYVSGALPAVFDTRVSTNILIGHFGSEIVLLTDAAERAGSQSMAGSDDLSAQAVIYASSDDPLIGEEMYAAGAYLDAGGAHVASLYAQDVLRWILILLILGGAGLKFLGLL